MKLTLLTLTSLLLAGPALAASDELEQSLDKLKTITAQSDPAEVKKAAADTCGLARKVKATPAAERDAGNWSKLLAFARDAELYSEYALYATAVKSEPPVTVDLMATLEQQNPKSKYLDEGYAAYFAALRQTDATAKIQGIAEKGIIALPENEDILHFLADAAMTKKQWDKAAAYAERLVAVLKKHPKPEAMAAADWAKKRSASLGAGYWMAGMVHSDKQQYPQADEDLRAAVPLIQNNPAMLAPALFQLSLANYELGKLTMDRGRVLQGAEFAEKVAAMKTALAQQAWTNAHLMRQEATKMARGGR